MGNAAIFLAIVALAAGMIGCGEPATSFSSHNLDTRTWCELHDGNNNLDDNYTFVNELSSGAVGYGHLRSLTADEGRDCHPIGDHCADPVVRDLVELDASQTLDDNPILEPAALDPGELASLQGWYWYDSYDNYAPSGMPDFDQRQNSWWKNPDARVPWTFCGPLVVANCFWWLDSKYADPAGMPGDGNDIFPLVRDYGGASAALPSTNWDDHNFSNVNDLATQWPPDGPPPTMPVFVPGPQPQPSDTLAWGELVERLAWYMDCDGIRSGGNYSGTYMYKMVDSINQWMEEKGLDHILSATAVAKPDFGFIVEKVKHGDCVILSVAWWDEEEPGEWKRSGGHDVTVAGVNAEELLIALSDPGFDQTPPDDPQERNDGASVSHDIWHVDLDCRCGAVTWCIRDYATALAASYGIDVISEAVVGEAVVISSLPPSVTTQAASAIGTTSVSLNMTYTLGGQTTADLRFGYRKASDGDWMQVPWVSVSAHGVYLSEVDTHEETLTGLDFNTTYEFRAELKYDEIVLLGDALNFTTMEQGRCFVATATYGTPMAEELEILREFRDGYLLTNSLGQAFVDFYYRISPPVAEFITEHPTLKPLVRAGLLPAVAISTAAVNTSMSNKVTIIGLLVLVSVVLVVWAARWRGREPPYRCD